MWAASLAADEDGRRSLSRSAPVVAIVQRDDAGHGPATSLLDAIEQRGETIAALHTTQLAHLRSQIEDRRMFSFQRADIPYHYSSAAICPDRRDGRRPRAVTQTVRLTAAG
jgi:hypothetical protein